MTEHKFTDEEIKKALECCVKAPRTCAECPLCVTSREPCNVTLASNALDLINRQQAEIESLGNSVRLQAEMPSTTL